MAVVAVAAVGFLAAFLEDEVEDDLVEIRVRGVAVLFPVDGVMVEFDVAVVESVPDFCGAVAEVRASSSVPFAEVDDFNGVPISGGEIFSEGACKPSGLEVDLWREGEEGALFVEERGGTRLKKLFVGGHVVLIL